jgi:uncharacterized protein
MAHSEPCRYRPRVVDGELDHLLLGLSAISLEGARGVGKTSTAGRRGGTLLRLDDPDQLEVVQGQPERLTAGTAPIVIDEWQRFPASWDYVRRAVDRDPAPGRFILTGSSGPTPRPTHSGAGRIVPLRMRPMTLAERDVETPSVSLGAVLAGGQPALTGTTEVTLEDYTREILLGGFPAMRHADQRTQRAALDGYLRVIIDTDLPSSGLTVRRPDTLLRWLRAYAAATSTTTSYDRIRDAATGGENDKPAKTTTSPYRDAMENLWILDPLPAWLPTGNRLHRLVSAPKHHLVDPALAARLLGVGADALLQGKGPDILIRDGAFLGALFESLATLVVRVLAQAHEAEVRHFRTRGGEHEVDLVVALPDESIVAIEVKMATAVSDGDVRNLLWLRDRLGQPLVDTLVLTTGGQAFRRRDGVGVVPLALLGV